MRRTLFWILAGLAFTGCHRVPDSNINSDGGTEVDMAAAECDPDEREWVATPVFLFENSEVQINGIWTDGEVGWIAGYQNRVGTQHATVWRLQTDRAVLEYERLDRDQVSFRAIDCIVKNNQTKECHAVGSRGTAAMLSDDGWIGTEIEGGDWRDVVGTPERFVAVDGERIETATGPTWGEATGPNLSRVGCTEGFCVGAGDGFVHTTNNSSVWPEEDGYEMPCNPDDECRAQAIEVPAQDVAMVASDAGFVYRTTDGGASWTGEDTQVASELIDLSMYDATHGWLVDGSGGILRTDDAETWESIGVVELDIGTTRRVFLYGPDQAWVAAEDGIRDVRLACP
jgi:hypothetical protein